MTTGPFAPLRLFTVAEYYRMGQVGILPEDDRVELIEGRVVERGAISSHHAGCVNKLMALLPGIVTAEPVIVRVQNPLHFSDYSEPQSDVAVVRARADFYSSAHPTADDVLFLIEVADASLMYDHHTKLPLYARSGIAEVWLVDLLNHVVEVHTAPTADGYEHTERFAGAALLPRLGVAASDILA